MARSISHRASRIFRLPRNSSARRPRRSTRTSINMPSPGGRSRFAMRSQRNTSARTSWSSIRSGRLRCAAELRKGMVASLFAVLDPGDEVVLFEPFYENYGPDLQLCGASARYVTLHAPDWSFDPEELCAAFTPRTKAIILNSPNNPTGKGVFAPGTGGDCGALPGNSIAWPSPTKSTNTSCGNDRHRTRANNVAAGNAPPDDFWRIKRDKTYSVTGWRVGWVLASPDLTNSIRKVHDFLTVGAAAPLQQAGVLALSLPEDYYRHLSTEYRARRDHLVQSLESAGFKCLMPRGAYYVMTDISAFGFADDISFIRHLITKVGVAAVPGSSFCAQQSGRKPTKFASVSAKNMRLWNQHGTNS